jgi:hypothetical protein
VAALTIQTSLPAAALACCGAAASPAAGEGRLNTKIAPPMRIRATTTPAIKIRGEAPPGLLSSEVAKRSRFAARDVLFCVRFFELIVASSHGIPG